MKWGRLVKFSHSIFALPFALSMFLIVAERQPVAMAQLAWIVVALVSARTAAMAFNRLIDRAIDARNPRTAMRELPRGEVSVGSAVALVVLSCAVFFAAAGALGRHCTILAPFVLLVLLGYSFCKRFTPYSHLVLGLALACAPGGVWYALTGHVALLPIWMMLGVALWVAGFDIIYACQDFEFDREQKLFSIPAVAGVRRALEISRVLHLVCALSLFLFGYFAGLSELYYIGLVIFSALLADQHRQVSADDLSRADGVFFSRNGLASIVFFLGVLADAIVHGMLII